VKVVVVYIYPLNGDGEWGLKASRFLDTYRRHPPGMSHDTVIVCNGAGCSAETEQRFSSMPNVRLVEHDNRGKDIGGYLKAAASVEADLMLFFGASSYFRRPEWMTPVMRSFFRKGDSLYGATAHPGEGGHIHPHIRTTGFWLRPKLLTDYCPTIIENERRYEFEHGASCMTNWFKNRGLTPWVVSWTGEHHLHQCQDIPNGYRTGDQSNVIFGDRILEEHGDRSWVVA
jgi:hypothetical protein